MTGLRYTHCHEITVLKVNQSISHSSYDNNNNNYHIIPSKVPEHLLSSLTAPLRYLITSSRCDAVTTHNLQLPCVVLQAHMRQRSSDFNSVQYPGHNHNHNLEDLHRVWVRVRVQGSAYSVPCLLHSTATHPYTNFQPVQAPCKLPAAPTTQLSFPTRPTRRSRSRYHSTTI